jgi:hypothetical protein
VIATDDIKKRFSPEIALVILMCRLFFKNATANEIDRTVCESAIDWNLFYKLVRTHEIRPFIYKIIVDNSLRVDNEVVQRLRADSLSIATTNLERLNEMVRLSEIFFQKNIAIVPYKGVILSQHLFDDFITRETCDIDFLIKSEDFSVVREIFLTEGYRTDYYYDKEYEDIILNTGCEYQFYRSGLHGIIKIEIHWSIIHKMQDVPITNEYLFKDCKIEKILGHEITVLNQEAELLMLLIHHGVNDVWRSLRHLLDISVVLQDKSGNIDWQTIMQNTYQFKVGNVANIGLALSKELFGVIIPKVQYFDNKAVNTVIHNLLKYPLITKNKLKVANLRQQLMIRDSFIDKIHLCWKYMITGINPNIRDIEKKRLSRKWFFLHYFIKPFRVLKLSNKR